jgi:hypothetical protein
MKGASVAEVNVMTGAEFRGHRTVKIYSVRDEIMKQYNV